MTTHHGMRIRWLVFRYTLRVARDTIPRSCCRTASLVLLTGLVGCATPQYALRPVPQPDESAAVVEIEETISAVQAKGFEKQRARRIKPGERYWGFDVPEVLARLSRVTERPGLRYRALLYSDQEPNAAALADGRVYLSTGMLDYLARRGTHEDELAFVLAHELAHTVAQHLVKRYQTLYKRQFLMAIVAAGVSLVNQGAGSIGQEAGQMAVDAASLLNELTISGYSQEREFEADQLGIRYVIKAGFDPQAGLDLLDDFSRFDSPQLFFRTHPYAVQRREYLRRYLTELRPGEPPAPTVHTRQPPTVAERRAHLRKVQELYPRDSKSWQNLELQIQALK